MTKFYGLNDYLVEYLNMEQPNIVYAIMQAMDVSEEDAHHLYNSLDRASEIELIQTFMDDDINDEIKTMKANEIFGPSAIPKNTSSPDHNMVEGYNYTANITNEIAKNNIMDWLEEQGYEYLVNTNGDFAVKCNDRKSEYSVSRYFEHVTNKWDKPTNGKNVDPIITKPLLSTKRIGDSLNEFKMDPVYAKALKTQTDDELFALLDKIRKEPPTDKNKMMMDTIVHVIQSRTEDPDAKIWDTSAVEEGSIVHSKRPDVNWVSGSEDLPRSNPYDSSSDRVSIGGIFDTIKPGTDVEIRTQFRAKGMPDTILDRQLANYRRYEKIGSDAYYSESVEVAEMNKTQKLKKRKELKKREDKLINPVTKIKDTAKKAMHDFNKNVSTGTNVKDWDNKEKHKQKKIMRKPVKVDEAMNVLSISGIDPLNRMKELAGLEPVEIVVADPMSRTDSPLKSGNVFEEITDIYQAMDHINEITSIYKATSHDSDLRLSLLDTMKDDNLMLGENIIDKLLDDSEDVLLEYKSNTTGTMSNNERQILGAKLHKMSSVMAYDIDAWANKTSMLQPLEQVISLLKKLENKVLNGLPMAKL